MRFYANKSKKEKGTLGNLYYTPTQEKEIIQIAGHIGLLLMERYAALAPLPNPNLEDSNLAVMLDTSERTIRATRAKLTKAKWFLRVKQVTNGETRIMYDIGKQAVSQNNKAYFKNAKDKAVKQVDTPDTPKSDDGGLNLED